MDLLSQGRILLTNVLNCSDPDVSPEVQEENGLKYTYHVYQRY